MRSATNSALAALVAAGLLGLVGCGTSSGTIDPAVDPTTMDVLKTGGGTALSKEAAGLFKKGSEAMVQHDRAGDWSDALCDDIASMFKRAADEQSDGKFHEALYNSGVAQQRCKNDAKARATFDELLGKEPKFHRARVQVALYEFIASGQKDVEKAIGEMNQAVTDAQFKNEEALVHLAMLQMMRDNDVSDDDGANDFERAKSNLQRALAINDSYMSAFNQLAIYYLEMAKKKALGEKAPKGKRRRGIAVASEDKKKADSQALELAALVCSQAIRKNPNYAPIYNTMGLISAELGDLSQSAQSFGKARALDAKFFEAHMNYAAVNLQFRGFEQAEDAYRKALGEKSNDFEAHLGLALALRGQITDANFDSQIAAVAKELDAARKIDGDRPETYYNDAILTQEYKSKTLDQAKVEGILEQSKTLFRDFLAKATGKDEYADAAKRAEERIKEIDDVIKFTRETREMEKKTPPAAAPAPGGANGTPPAEGKPEAGASAATPPTNG